METKVVKGKVVTHEKWIGWTIMKVIYGLFAIVTILMIMDDFMYSHSYGFWFLIIGLVCLPYLFISAFSYMYSASR
jgi:hypothetical protein